MSVCPLPSHTKNFASGEVRASWGTALIFPALQSHTLHRGTQSPTRNWGSSEELCSLSRVNEAQQLGESVLHVVLGCVYSEDVGLQMGSQRAEPFCNGLGGVWVSTPWAEGDVLGMNVPWEVGWEDPHPAIVGKSFPFRADSGSGNPEKHGSWKHCCGEEVVLMEDLCSCRVVPRGGAPMHSHAAHLPSPPHPMPELRADGRGEEEESWLSVITATSTLRGLVPLSRPRGFASFQGVPSA